MVSLPVLLLTSRIQNIEQRYFLVNDTLFSVRVFDSRIVFVNEMTLNELDRQGRLSDTTTTDDDEFVLSQELCFRRHDV